MKYPVFVFVVALFGFLLATSYAAAESDEIESYAVEHYDETDDIEVTDDVSPPPPPPPKVHKTQQPAKTATKKEKKTKAARAAEPSSTHQPQQPQQGMMNKESTGAYLEKTLMELVMFPHTFALGNPECDWLLRSTEITVFQAHAMVYFQEEDLLAKAQDEIMKQQAPEAEKRNCVKEFNMMWANRGILVSAANAVRPIVNKQLKAYNEQMNKLQAEQNPQLVKHKDAL